MNYFDNEKNIISWFQDVDCSSVCFPIENDELISIFKSIYNPDLWKLWKNSSGKADPPPDFYCDQYQLMMDIMRVDDHAFISKKGKVVNPTNARESKIQKELEAKGIKTVFPNVENIFINAITDLPTEEDHNYGFYKSNFIRTIEEHKKKISLYQKNHPNYKTIFFIMDESSAYVESDIEKQKNNRKVGKMLIGRPHIPFVDATFLNTLINSNIDYVIWFMPFKYIDIGNGKMDLPEICVIDTKDYHIDLLRYNDKCMISAEA